MKRGHAGITPKWPRDELGPRLRSLIEPLAAVATQSAGAAERGWITGMPRFKCDGTQNKAVLWKAVVPPRSGGASRVAALTLLRVP